MTTNDERRGMSGIFADAGALLISPMFRPGVSAVSRPVLKTAIHGYFAASDWAEQSAHRLSEAAQDSSEQMSDLVAEVRAERQAAQSRALEKAQAQPSETAESPAPTGPLSPTTASPTT